MIRYMKEIVVVVVLLCAVLMVWQSASTHIAVSSQTLRPARGGPIHGYVGAAVSASSDSQGRLINVPDIEVFARNTKTGAASSKVITNPQGYFRTPSLAPGTYQICVERVGYASSCDSQTIEVASSIRVLDHVVPIRPRPRALTGTVRLADLVTPCFWFRPAFDTNAVLDAEVALVDGSGNLVAGPVNGNSLGQYVLPTPSRPVRSSCASPARVLRPSMKCGPFNRTS